MSARTAKSAKPSTTKKIASSLDKPNAATARSKPAADRPKPDVEKAAPPVMKPDVLSDDDREEAAAKPPAAAEPAGLVQPRGLDGSTITKIWLGALAVTILLTVLLGTLYGRATGVLVLVTAAFCAVIALFWSSLRTLLGETVLQSADAFAIGAHGGEDEQKRAVLRALKDLEFERGVGKISEADYKILVAKLRARAKDLLRQLDEEGAEKRRLAEKIVEARVANLVEKGEAAPRPGAPAAPTTDDDEDEDRGADEDDDDVVDEANDGLSVATKNSSAKVVESKKDQDDDDDDDGDDDEPKGARAKEKQA